MVTDQSRLLSADPWAARLGITAVSAPEGTARVVMDLTADHMNFLDSAHGGALFSLAEAAVREACGRGDAQVIDAHLTLTAGAPAGDRFVAVAEPVNVGRTLAVYQATVTRGDGRVCGVLTATVRLGA